MGGCQDGNEGCACYPNDTCNEGLSCTGGWCIPEGCTPGSENCTCAEGDLCLTGLVCDEGLCRMETTGSGSGTSAGPGTSTSAGPTSTTATTTSTSAGPTTTTDSTSTTTTTSAGPTAGPTETGPGETAGSDGGNVCSAQSECSECVNCAVNDGACALSMYSACKVDEVCWTRFTCMADCESSNTSCFEDCDSETSTNTLADNMIECVYCRECETICTEAAAVLCG